MYNPNYYNWGPEGWRCPKCGRVYNPSIPMCFYCSNNESTFQTSGTNINDSEWWKDYLKKSQTCQPTNNNSSINTATTTTNPNVKVSTWNKTKTDQIKIGKDGSISWMGPAPSIYLENMSWRDYLDFNTNAWEE